MLVFRTNEQARPGAGPRWRIQERGRESARSGISSVGGLARNVTTGGAVACYQQRIRVAAHPAGPRAMQICLWRPAAGRGSLTLTAIGGPLAAHTVRLERRLGRAVPGVGDEGYLRAGQVCVARRGECVLKLVLSGSRAHDPAAAVVRLARQAVSRLNQGDGPGWPR